MKPLIKPRIFTPGPTPLLPDAMLQPLVVPMHHRKEDFKSVFRDVQEGLRQLFKTRNEILLLSCSGSGAMEAAMTNLINPGERVVVGVAGKFGERWLELTARFGVEAEVIRTEYGESVDPDKIAAALASNPDASAIFVQATETSTGAKMDLERIGALVRNDERKVLVVDAITGLGTMKLETDKWGLDVVIGGSQKAFMVPPGVAMISVSPRAWARMERCNRPRYYFDLLRERKGQKDGQAGFTPAISIIQGLKSALSLILRNGADGIIFNAGLQAGAMRAAVAGWNMRLFPRSPGDAITCFVPGKADPSTVISIMRDRFGVLISGGQGSMKGKILRVGHLGYTDFFDTLGVIGCLEIALIEAGADIGVGAGTAAALRHYQEATRES